MPHPTTEFRLRAMLVEARNQFQLYGDMHMEKVPPQYEKAGVNYGFVREINDTLLNAHTLPDSDAFDDAYEALNEQGVDLSPEGAAETLGLEPQPPITGGEEPT